ncbi:relaxase/mobilization nuclease domain-containing protein [Streptomyces fildesensis]|uniref:relaxase/mobilization nuclease domain-containing protein n=1 Tax=Streptomyces fildesensis TaxID=375757 RepID=UPI0018DFCCCF|nr:mobilization protein [Streptomyces fildesensis]
MVPDVSTGGCTRGLLNYLYGPGRRDEHTDAHIVGAWAMTGIPDPGRDREATLPELAAYLDQPVKLRAREIGRTPPKHVWHCPVRTAPGDRYLTDAEWGEVARRIVHATGIAPDGDDHACRWIAVRHAEDHIHIVATTVREDGRRPRNNQDGVKAQAACRSLEKQLGLRQLKQGDYTAPRTPTSAEQAKAQRQGQSVTTREWLREQAYAVLAASRDEAEYFTVLESLGIEVKPRIGPQTGEVIGYSLAAPGDVNGQGEPIWYGGSKVAPDLSITRLRERLAAQEPADRPTDGTRPASPWLEAETILRRSHTVLDSDDDAGAQAHLAAFGELLHTTAQTAPAAHREQLRAAATAFNRANRTALRADHQQATALRSAAKAILAPASPGDGGAALAALLSTAVLIAIAAAQWHDKRGQQQQAAAAQQAITHLTAGYQQMSGPLLADLTQRAPRSEATRRFEADLRRALPDHAERILADPAWPALTTTLARAESAGHTPRHLLTQAAARRELDTAASPAEVLNWRITGAPNRRHQAATARSAHITTPNPAKAPLPPLTPRQLPAIRNSRHGR